MFYINIAALAACTVLLNILIKKILSETLLRRKNNYERLEHIYAKLSRQNARLEKENSDLEKSTQETIALYDITKDICKTLDQEEMFAIFRERISKYVRVSDCRFIKDNEELLRYHDYTALPLTIQDNTIGYLAAAGIAGKDRDKFHILAQQFLLGLKRAFLYQEVQRLTITDGLTQAFSRRYFLEKLNEEIKRSKKFKYNFSFLMVDIDHFKNLNDTYGHLVGDAVLREAAKTIKENIRQIDFIGRYGGEELSVVLVETDKKQAAYAAERIRQAIESGLKFEW